MSPVRDISLSAVVAGFVTVLVGFTSTAVIVFQAAHAVGAGPAMLITAAAGVSLAEAIGAFIVSGVLICVAGFSGWFERALNRIPISIASGMLAGVQLRFGLELFVVMKAQFAPVFAMFAAYLLMRRFSPRYAVIVAFALGIAIAAALGLLHLGTVHLELAQPVWTMPAVIRASGYAVPISPVIGWTGVVNVALAPFGAFALNLAAIPAAICMRREAQEDPRRRCYRASVCAGDFSTS